MTIRIPGAPAQLELDPTLLERTLRRVPAARNDLGLLLREYPGFVSLRFDGPARAVDLVFEATAKRPRVVVRAYEDATEVDDDHLTAAGTASVRADRITHLRFSLSEARLVSFCVAMADTTTSLTGWKAIATLPLVTTWPTASPRLPAPFRAAYRPGWDGLRKDIARLVDPRDRRRRWERTFTETGTRTGGRSSTPPPTWTYDVQQRLQLFAIDPFIARVLGLYFVDLGAAAGTAYDYLVTARFQTRGRPRNVGWISYGLTRDAPPPLAPPAIDRVETITAGFLPDPATGELVETLPIGLAWTQPLDAEGRARPNAPVRYDVEVRLDGATTWRSLTERSKAVIAAPETDVGTREQPPFSFYDRGRPAGTHTYRVFGIDVFNRRSAPSAAASVTVVDTLGPPHPRNISGSYLDPADPYLSAEQAMLGEGLLVTFDYPHPAYAAGSDAATFSVYTSIGSRDRALDWTAPTTWGTPLAEVPFQSAVAGRVTGVTAVATSRTDETRYRVQTDLAWSESTGIDANGSSWSTAPGYLRIGNQDYPVDSIETGASAAFTVAYPTAWALVRPPVGACDYYPGYRVHAPAFSMPIAAGSPSAVGALVVGAHDVRGNDGPLSPMVGFQRVDRAVPASPGAAGATSYVASRPNGYWRSSFTFSWVSGGSDVRYFVERAIDGTDGQWSRLTAEAIDATSYTDDTLEGRSRSSYYYRVQSVSVAGVLGGRCDPIGPVTVPDVVPPAVPRLAGVAAGDGSISLAFTQSPDVDTEHYVVYRATSADDATDIRLMTAVGTVAHRVGLIAADFLNDSTTTSPPAAKTDYWYRITAVDTTGNESGPSNTMRARCFSTAPPISPALAVTRSTDGTAATATWTGGEDGLRALLRRRLSGATTWSVRGAWLDAATALAEDTGLDPTAAYDYALLVMNASAVQADSNTVEVPVA
jgi:hypothetical protein